MITVDVSTWTELVEAFNNGGTKYTDDVTIKLISDIDCNAEIPEGVEATISPNTGNYYFILDGGYGDNQNHVIRNLRTHVVSPVGIFRATSYGLTLKNIDFINLILDSQLLTIGGNSSTVACTFNNCRFVGRRTYNLWDNIYKTTAGIKTTGVGVKLYSCFFNIPYIKSPYVAADVPLERNDATGSYLKYNSYAYFCRFVESHNADTGIISCDNLKLSGCYVQGELTSSSPITIISQYEYDSAVQNVVNLTLKTTEEQGTIVVVNAPKGIWKDAIYSTDSTILTPYQYTNTNPLAIPESPTDMMNASELYSDGFDVQRPNLNSVGGNNG